MKLKTLKCRLQLVWDREVGEVVKAIVFLVNNQYSFLVKLLDFLTVMFARKRLVRKRLLLLMSSETKM